MESDRLTRIEGLFHEIVDLSPASRAARLELGCGADLKLRRQVESLVAAYEHVGTVFGSLDRTAPGAAPTEAEPQPVLPTHRRYQVLRELGRGGMGIVYVARDVQLDRAIALKFLPPRLNDDRAARTRLMAEARAAAMLDHPNIATVFEVGESEEGRLFIAMAYYPGGSVRDRLERGPIGRDEAVSIATQVAEGLAAAHKQGLVHRDIKPGNLLVTESGLVKIVDFGLAERTDPESTRATHIMGTVAYMSPEQTRGLTVDARTDLWSLGVVLYEMLAGRRPFQGDSALALLYAILDDAPARLPETVPDRDSTLQRVIDRALMKDPGARYQSAEEMLAELRALDVPALHAGPAAAAPVYLTSFVGRERETDEARRMLRVTRLVTLTGPPGTGKTRLAVRLAAELAPEFRHGHVFVPLAATTDAALVPSAIAQVLGLRATGQLSTAQAVKDLLRDRHVLLILDNFEQILPAAALVAELVAACPRLTVLVTSRASLRLSGERDFPVPPLACPDPAQLGSVAAVSAAEAVALFVERATAIHPGFHLDPQNAASVAEICRRLDGLPLAIELAAARVKVLPPKAILARLEHRLDLLKGGARDVPSRHQTLRQAIAWSYALLEREEKRLLRHLSVFVGGHTLEAAEAVIAAATSSVGTLEGLESLLDKNLLRQETQPDGEPRFTMLETLREFGLECLRAGGEEGTARRAHRDYYLGLVERTSPDLTGPQQTASLDRLEQEHDNLRAAFEWSVESGEWEPAERLAAGLWRFWLVRGHLTEGRDRLHRLLSISADASPRRARLLTAAGTLAHNQGDYAAARAHYEESLALSRTRNDEVAVANTLNDLGWVAWRQADYAAARELSDEALALHQRLGDQRGMAHALNNLGWVAHHRGDYAGAREFHSKSLELRKQSGDQRGIAFALTNLGWAVARLGDLDEAVRLVDRACEMLRQVGERQLLAFALTVRAEVWCAGGDPRTALAVLDESTRIFRQIGDRYGLALALNVTAVAHGELEDHERAAELASEALALRRAIGDRWGIAQSLGTLGRLAQARHRPNQALAWLRESVALWAELDDRASLAEGFDSLGAAIGDVDAIAGGRLFGAADALRRAAGIPARRIRAPAPQLRAADEAPDVAHAWAEGAAMLLPDAVRLALADPSRG